MAKKKEKEMTCPTSGGPFPCSGLMAILIIVLVWVSPATWSKIVITIAAALVLLGAGGRACMKAKKK
ncbi:hypothetical protein HOA55_03580 [archaeon]|nr:hypothetical protein [archaeon]MBT3577345.1 hypothetical protein [archaeon]MBT6820411.1 hypothetical protein [archaeon]MBT6956055.1 hypothetical protein [archaeon]MBT7025225.1 hypothetical protein [archaeon]